MSWEIRAKRAENGAQSTSDCDFQATWTGNYFFVQRCSDLPQGELVKYAVALLLIGFFATSSVNAQDIYYGPPYTNNSYGGSIPPSATIQEQIDAVWAIYQANHPHVFPGCGYTMQYGAVPDREWIVAIQTLEGTCHGYTWVLASSHAYNPGKNLGPCPPGSCSLAVGNPINSATGNKYQHESDAIISDVLRLERSYNSSTVVAPANLGWNWRHTYDRRIEYIEGVDPTVIVLRETGQRFIYTKVGNDWRSDPDVKDTVTEEVVEGTRTGWTVRSASTLHREHYSAEGVLLSVDNREGQVVHLSYSDASTPPSVAPAPGLLLAATDSSGRKLTLTYDVGGRIQGVALPDGTGLTYLYDSNGRLSQVAYPGSSTRTYWYNETHLMSGSNNPVALTGITDEGNNRFASFGYDAQGLAILTEHGQGSDRFQIERSSGITVTNPLGGTVDYQLTYSHGTANLGNATQLCAMCGVRYGSRSFDANGFPDQTVDFKGSTTDEDFDANGLVTSRVEAAQSTSQRMTETDWDGELRKPIEKRQYDASNALLNKVAWTYNTRGQALTVTQTDPASSPTRTTTTAYCEQADITAGTCPLLGLVKSVDGPRTDASDIVAYTYRIADAAGCAASPTICAYRKGDLWKVADALGHVTETLAYDGAGRPLSVKDPGGVVTDFEYHPRGWLTARKLRGINGASETDDRITRMEYWPTGLVKKVIQPDGAYTAYAYDAAHRLTDVSDNAGNTIHYTLDNAGNRTKEDTRDPSGNLKRTLSRIYNQLGQLATQADADANPTDFAYDANGNADTVTDALGRVTDNDYDPLNRLKRTLQDVGGIAAETKFEYDALDNLTKVVDPKGLDTAYTYNGFSDLTQLSSPDTGTTTYTYDSAGNRKTQTDARGVQTTYGYDALNRLVQVSYPTTSLNASYAYDTAPSACQSGETYAKGRLSSMTDASGGTAYCYDRFGDLVRKVQTVNGVAFTVRYAYTKAGQMSGVTYPDGTTVDYVRNALGQATEVGVTRSGGMRQVLLTGASYAPFGPATGWIYGNGRQLNRPLDQDYRPVAIQDTAVGGLDLGFGFDASGNLDELTPAGGSTPLVKFGYDALNRLTHYRDGPTDVAIETYAYDKTGNRTSFQNSAGMQAYAYPATSHRLSEVDGVARSYDAAGSTTAIGSGRQFVYNDAGRMAQVEASGVVTAAYDYNGKGERVRKVAGGTEVYTLYDEAGRWLGDYDDPDGPYQQVVWLDDLPVGVVPGASPQLHYIEPDHLGTPRVVIEPARNVAVWKWDLKSEAFGNSAPNQDPDGDSTAFAFDMRYPGQRYDNATGLHYNYFRDYESGTGRYTQSDPLGIADGPSTYAYAKGDPLALFDQFGLATFIGFSKERRAEMEAAVEKAISVLKKCNSCTDCGQNGEYEGYCMDDFEKSKIIYALQHEAIFEYRPKNPIYSDGSTILGEHLGASHIAIYPRAFTHRKSCALALPSLLAHEVGHYVLGGLEAHNQIYFMESRCFACKAGPGW